MSERVGYEFIVTLNLPFSWVFQLFYELIIFGNIQLIIIELYGG